MTVPLTSTMYDTCRWIDMFETLCARYQCRSVESLARASLHNGCGDGDDVFFVSGPSGKWLAEITSVTLKKRRHDLSSIRLADTSKLAVCEIVNFYERKETRDNAAVRHDTDEIALDWFAFRSTGVSSVLNFTTRWQQQQRQSSGGDADYDEEDRQCIWRIDRNNRLITVLLLANTTKLQKLSSISISCNAHNESCLRPFPFILACELTIRKIAYENLNLHQDSFSETVAAKQCWLTKAREMYKRAKWLRVIRYDSEADMRDRIVCQRVNVTGVRLLWRDGYVFRSTSSLFTQRAAHLLPLSAIIDLSVVRRDVRSDERSILSLCDFDVFVRRCEHSLASNCTARRNGGGEMTLAYEFAAGIEDDEDIARKRRRRQHDAIYESRYFVNADNELISRRFVRLS